MKEETKTTPPMNEVLRRMLSTPPEPHAPSTKTTKKAKPKPKKKPA